MFNKIRGFFRKRKKIIKFRGKRPPSYVDYLVLALSIACIVVGAFIFEHLYMLFKLEFKEIGQGNPFAIMNCAFSVFSLVLVPVSGLLLMRNDDYSSEKKFIYFVASFLIPGCLFLISAGMLYNNPKENESSIRTRQAAEPLVITS